MLDLKKTTKNQLLDPVFSQEVFKEANEATLFIGRHTKELAEFFVQQLDLDNYDQELSSLEKEYLVWVSKLRFAVLTQYSDREVESFFEQRIYDAAGLEELDIWEVTRIKLIDVLIENRDVYKDRLRKALLRNIQPVPAQFAMVISNNKLESNVKNWFRDYFSQVGTEETDKLKQAQYFSNSPNFIKLADKDKEKLKILIHLYHRLGISSWTPEGVEETMTMMDKNGQLFDLQDGIFVRMDKETSKPLLKEKEPVSPVSQVSPIDPMELLKQKYQTYRTQRQPVLKLEDGILVKTQGDVENIKKELAVASRNNDENRVVACLKILARQKVLQTALVGNPAWFEAVSNYIAPKYGQQYEPEEVTAALSNLKMNPTTPAAVSEFLQYLLIEKLGLSQDASALVGVEIGQILGDEYQGLAYGNQETGSFEWTKNKIESEKLVSE